MAVTPVVFREASASDLESAFNVALAPLLSSRIFGVEITQQKNAPAYARNLAAAFTYDTNGIVLTAPFQAHVVSESDDAPCVSKINEFVSANPSYFFSEVYAVYRPLEADPNEASILVIFYNTAGAIAAANWGGSGGGGSPFGVQYNAFVNSGNIPSSAQYVEYNGIGGHTLVLPPANSLSPRSMLITVKNLGGGDITLQAFGGDLIEGLYGSITMVPEQSLIFGSNTLNRWGLN